MSLSGSREVAEVCAQNLDTKEKTALWRIIFKPLWPYKSRLSPYVVRMGLEHR